MIRLKEEQLDLGWTYDDLQMRVAHQKVANQNQELIKANIFAGRIQQSILPKKYHFDRLELDAFLYYQPKNYVSGDFYWLAQKDGCIYVALGDCTGHGPAGGLLSVLGISLLNHIVLNKGLTSLRDIITEMDAKLITTFPSSNSKPTNNDWMDLAIVKIDPQQHLVHYVCANSKMVILNGNDTVICQGVKYPVGGWQIEPTRDFHENVLSYNKGDLIYLFSDGFKDQIGSRDNKKFGSPCFYKILQSLSELHMYQQEQVLDDVFRKWKGLNEQTDDVAVVGLKL
ncbi:MAG: PP2C family protein-serine/threonine phosphatase [Flavobacteriales bacterium]